MVFLISCMNFNRSLEMDKVEQAQFQTIMTRKLTEMKQDYNSQIFVEYHRMDLGKLL